MKKISINIKTKIKEIFEKYQILFLIIAATLVVAAIIIVIYSFVLRPRITLKHYSNSLYTVHYDSTWDLTKKENNKLELKHEDANVNIEITTITNDYLYMSLENIIDETVYAIEQNNPDYYLIGKQKILATKNKYEGYQLLYENEKNEVLLTLFKKENKIISIVYEASYEDFDILLDSVKEIIYNFDLVNAEYASSYNLSEFKNEKMFLNGNDDIKVNATEKYQIADNHYLVKFEVPSNFRANTYNSRYSYLTLDELSTGNVSLTANIYESNLYEVLTKLKEHTFDYSIKYSITNGKLLNETFTKVSDEKYMYHVVYTYEDYRYDVVYLIYELDYRRTFVVAVKALNCYLSNELIEHINLKSATKYASYIYRNIEDNNLINEMKYAYTAKDTYQREYNQVILYTPTNYIELDDGFSNMYENRTFNKNYNEESKEYDFKVQYEINSLQISNNLNILETTYYDKKDRKKIGTKTYNDKKFEVYTYNAKKKYITILFHKLSSGNYLQIIIESNNKKISNNEIKELTKFTESINKMN